MSLRSFGQRFSRILVSLSLLSAVVYPISLAKPVAAFNRPDHFKQNVLHIKVKDASTLNSALLNNILNSAGQVNKKAKLHDKTGNSPLENSLDAATGNYYTITFKSNVNMDQLVNKLKGVNGVETAYPEPQPAPAPSTPSFVSMENYLTPSPNGTNANFAKSFPGGNGNMVKLIDIEYSWNSNHEDLSKAKTAVFKVHTPSDPFNDNSHGTATIGEIVADNNTYGMTGAAPGVSLELINVDSAEKGYDPVSALYVAALTSKPGDVIMIEQQTWGLNGELLPIEWLPEVYDMIHTLTANGRNVIEPAANGGVNLDDPAYGTSFPMGKADSGAIIVGAGTNCSGETRLGRASFSDYGKRVNLQGPGDCVATTGYGDLYSGAGPNSYYTQSFNGTSSATPVVAAAAASFSSAWLTINGSALSPAWVRLLLAYTGTPQNTGSGTVSGNIGPLPNLAKALPLTDQIKPSVPSNVKVALNSSGKPVVTWTASTDNYKVSYYLIVRNNALYAASATASYTDTNVVAGTTYTYSVAAIDATGQSSALSSPATVVVH